MTEQQSEQAPRFYNQTWDLEYRHALGETTGRFLGGLAEGKIWGVKSQDGRVIVPPRSYDDHSLTRNTEWVEVNQTGVIEMSTVVYEAFRGLPDPPYAIGYALLDGADTALVGYIRGVELADQETAIEGIRIGTRVKVVFADEPTGTSADYWFEPVD